MTNLDRPPAAAPIDPAPPSGDEGARRGPAAAVSRLIASLYARIGTWGTFTAPRSAQMSGTDLAEYRTSLAVHRTLMGADRSLMAWIRTALSMVSFGFTIYKILQSFEDRGGSLGVASQPRVVALLLIGIGIVSILLGIMEYWQRAKDLSAHEDIPIWRATFIVAVAIALLSVSLLIAVSFKAL
jgi:putative membrane protein